MIFLSNTNVAQLDIRQNKVSFQETIESLYKIGRHGGSNQDKYF